MQADGLAAPLLAPAGDGPDGCSQLAQRSSSSRPGLRWRVLWEAVHEVVLPLLILALGVGFSIAALYVAVLPWLPAR